MGDLFVKVSLHAANHCLKFLLQLYLQQIFLQNKKAATATAQWWMESKRRTMPSCFSLGTGLIDKVWICIYSHILFGNMEWLYICSQVRLENIREQSRNLIPNLFSSFFSKGKRANLVTITALTAITHLTAYLSLFGPKLPKSENGQKLPLECRPLLRCRSTALLPLLELKLQRLMTSTKRTLPISFTFSAALCTSL